MKKAASQANKSGLSPRLSVGAMILGLSLPLSLGGVSLVPEVTQAAQRSSTDVTSLNADTHLYGEVPQPNQTRQGYVLFQHHNGNVVGATYYPRSEFVCFTGSLKNNALKMQPLSLGEAVPSTTTTMPLSELHSIPAISENDQRILSACKQETLEVANEATLRKLSALLR